MRAAVLVTLSFTFALFVTSNLRLVAEQANASHTHIGHVADGWRDTPDGQGFLPTATAEATIAAQHAGLAAGNTGDLDSMKRHTGHVLHAVEPTAVAGGPGLGYGVKQAAEGAAKHIEAAAAADGASQAVTTHATHVATSARNTVARADELVALAARINAATSAEQAAPLVAELNTLAQQLIDGNDANSDGRVGWQEGEGGLAQAEQHLGLMKKAEGLP